MAPLAGAAEKRERLLMRIEHQFLCLARVRTDKLYPAVAQTHLRHFHGRGDATEHHHPISGSGRSLQRRPNNAESGAIARQPRLAFRPGKKLGTTMAWWYLS
jgi:hypothetical protein